MATGMARSCVHRTLNDETHSRYGRTGTWCGKSRQIILAPGHFTVTFPGTYPRVWQSVCSSGRMTSKNFRYRRRDTSSVANGLHGRPALSPKSTVVYDRVWPDGLEMELQGVGWAHHVLLEGCDERTIQDGVTLVWCLSAVDPSFC
jgi:hypothetical protein